MSPLLTNTLHCPIRSHFQNIPSSVIKRSREWQHRSLTHEPSPVYTSHFIITLPDLPFKVQDAKSGFLCIRGWGSQCLLNSFSLLLYLLSLFHFHFPHFCICPGNSQIFSAFPWTIYYPHSQMLTQTLPKTQSLDQIVHFQPHHASNIPAIDFPSTIII